MAISIAKHAPYFIKNAAKEAVTLARTATASTRVLPDFLIIGAMKGGTTSLFNYLASHPSVVEPRDKEIHYFDWNFARGCRWYRGNFPTSRAMRRAKLATGLSLTGEASPYYLFHPLTPQRCHEMLPDAKLIVLLREPVSRTVSHYHYEVLRGRENLTLEEAIEREQDRLSGETKRIESELDYNSWDHRYSSYLARSIYIDQLERWVAFYPQEHMLILQSEFLFANTEECYAQTLEFLGLSEFTLEQFKRMNKNHYPEVRDSTRDRLLTFFKPHNERLYKFLNRRYDW